MYDGGDDEIFCSINVVFFVLGRKGKLSCVPGKDVL